MAKNSSPLIPSCRKILMQLGDNIKLARLRRDLSMANVAMRAGISPRTLGEIEKGSEKVQIGLYLNVLFVLGLHNDFLPIAQDDDFGRKLQDMGLNKRAGHKRASKSSPKL